MSALQIFLYVAFAVFVAGTAWKVYRIARMPIHLRWDLYPIPHEKGRAHYGGSYYEEVDWWTKPRETSRLNELLAMAKEIFFIQSLYHHNRTLWIWSFPFHLGLYLMVGFVVLLAAGGVLAVDETAFSLESDGLPTLVYILYVTTFFCGLAGSIFMTLGAAGLLVSRFARADLRASSSRMDYFNLLLLGAVGASLIILFVSHREDLLDIYFFVKHLLMFSAAPSPAPVTATHIFLAGVFMLWLPMTHMTHFVGKYFTYHRVRWEDHPNLRGSKSEAALNKSLGYPITWSAPHITKGSTWAEAASEPGREEKKP